MIQSLPLIARPLVDRGSMPTRAASEYTRFDSAEKDVLLGRARRLRPFRREEIRPEPPLCSPGGRRGGAEPTAFEGSEISRRLLRPGLCQVARVEQAADRAARDGAHGAGRGAAGP